MFAPKLRALALSTKRRLRRRPAAFLSVGAVGLTLVVAGCGSAAGTSTGTGGYGPAGARATPTAPAAKGATQPAAAAPTKSTAAQPPAAAPSTKPVPGTPQQNGGDADADNNGGPDDGDGAI
jgi:hypothetical protein